MLSVSASTLLLATGLLSTVAASSSARGLHARDGPSPALPHDPNTSTYCSWWVDVSAATTCDTILSDNFITLENFRRWNPSLTATCAVEVGKSYCVEVVNEPAPTSTTLSTTTTRLSTTTTTLRPSTTTTTLRPSTTTTTTRPPTTTTTRPPTTTTTTLRTTTTTGNGITTPTPTQPTIVSNCDAFYFVVSGDTCDTISAKHGITTAQFQSWNPSAGASCTGLWANAYACVSIIGHTPPKPSTTTPGNGIATPTPIQPNMVGNCDRFYKVKSGDTCATISSANGVTVSQLTTWNPTVKSDCTALWLDYFICTSIVGHTPTTPGNSVQTPTPFQTGMTTSCKTFHFVTSGQTCATITARYGITAANFLKWNPAVKSDCTGMWANTYACIAVL